MIDSGAMSFQAVLLHCPSIASDGLLMCHADVSGQFPDGSHLVIPHTGYRHQQLRGHAS
jgi:hypothetical protein